MAYTSPAALAECLADVVFANDDSPYAAVAILRFDAIDVPGEIDRLSKRTSRTLDTALGFEIGRESNALCRCFLTWEACSPSDAIAQ